PSMATRYYAVAPRQDFSVQGQGDVALEMIFNRNLEAEMLQGERAAVRKLGRIASNVDHIRKLSGPFMSEPILRPNHEWTVLMLEVDSLQGLMKAFSSCGAEGDVVQDGFVLRNVTLKQFHQVGYMIQCATAVMGLVRGSQQHVPATPVIPAFIFFTAISSKRGWTTEDLPGALRSLADIAEVLKGNLVPKKFREEWAEKGALPLLTCAHSAVFLEAVRCRGLKDYLDGLSLLTCTVPSCKMATLGIKNISQRHCPLIGWWALPLDVVDEFLQTSAVAFEPVRFKADLGAVEELQDQINSSHVAGLEMEKAELARRIREVDAELESLKRRRTSA
ncbi:unnamed protein product, partial [Effrenium voratum]